MVSPVRQSVPTVVLFRQSLLALGALIAVPLLFYPKTLGLPAFNLSPLFSLIEWGFYLGVFTVVGTRLSTSTSIVTAGFTVVCRLALGMVLGTFAAWTNMKPWAPTVSEMMWSYPLSLILHILLVPLVLRPMWENLLLTEAKPPRRRRVAGFAPTMKRPVRPAARSYGSRATRPSPSGTSRGAVPAPGALTGGLVPEPSFDDAVSYVGEYGGVRLCWMVDAVGLPLAVWQRQQYSRDAEYWAPVSVEAADFLRHRFSAGGDCRPERLEARTDQGRLIVEAVGDFWLGVLTDTEADDLIGVRLSRAREMIAKTLDETGRRYAGAGEAHYV